MKPEQSLQFPAIKNNRSRGISYQLINVARDESFVFFNVAIVKLRKSSVKSSFCLTKKECPSSLYSSIKVATKHYQIPTESGNHPKNLKGNWRRIIEESQHVRTGNSFCTTKNPPSKKTSNQQKHNRLWILDSIKILETLKTNSFETNLKDATSNNSFGVYMKHFS